MNTVHYPVQQLESLFQRQKVATMPELKASLGTSVDATVFGKLSALSYRSSYSHRGAYYTLNSMAQFDEFGLWSCQDVLFSRHGTLLNTAAKLVTDAPAGYFAHELEAVVHLEVKDALRQLVNAGRLHRRELEGRYLYCAADRSRRQAQWASRQAQAHQEDEMEAAMVLFYSLLDEQQRRLYAGMESLQRGHGGDVQMAKLLGLDVGTVARGRAELMSGQVLRERVRRAGGGRPRAEKNAWNLEHAPAVAAGGHGGRPDGTAGSLDQQTLGADQPRVATLGHSGLSKHRPPFAGPTGLCFARQSQESLGHQEPTAGPSVPLHQAAAQEV